jgi:hypothetical protein
MGTNLTFLRASAPSSRIKTQTGTRSRDSAETGGRMGYNEQDLDFVPASDEFPIVWVKMVRILQIGLIKDGTIKVKIQYLY